MNWRDWRAQPEGDLEQARASRSEGRHEWACFVVPQSAEKAFRALHLSLNQEARGHVVARILSELLIEVRQPLIETAEVIDGFIRVMSSRPDTRLTAHHPA